MGHLWIQWAMLLAGLRADGLDPCGAQAQSPAFYDPPPQRPDRPGALRFAGEPRPEGCVRRTF